MPTQRKGKPKVLCIDGSRKMLDFYEQRLSDHYEVALADSGIEALRVYDHSGPFPVIVIDRLLAAAHEGQTLRVMKACNPKSVCIVLSTHQHERNLAGPRGDSSAVRFLSKPCPVDVLCDTIDEAYDAYLGQIRGPREGGQGNR